MVFEKELCAVWTYVILKLLLKPTVVLTLSKKKLTLSGGKT
jgi:hypothetical protein